MLIDRIKGRKIATEMVFQDREWHTEEIDNIASLLQVNVNDGLNESGVKLRQSFHLDKRNLFYCLLLPGKKDLRKP